MWVTCRRRVIALGAVAMAAVIAGTPAAGLAQAQPVAPASAAEAGKNADQGLEKSAALNAALTRLIRAMNFARLMTIGMERAFARMPEKIGPIPRDKLKACTYARLSPDVLEQVVRPAFAMTFTDPALMIQLAAVFESSFGMKLIELVIENKPVEQAEFTPAEIAEANRFGQTPEIAQFLSGDGFQQLIRSIYPYVVTAGAQAREACVRELLPRQLPVQNPRPV